MVEGGITAKAVGEYFGVKPTAITQKTFDVEFRMGIYKINLKKWCG